MTDRLIELKLEAMDDRLKKGAAYLGETWMRGLRCASGWKGSCGCGAGETAFCRGKLRWVALLLERNGGCWPYELSGQEDFAVIEAMTVSTFKASGLTAIVSMPGVSTPIRFGARGTPWQTMVDLALTEPGAERDGALRAVELIQKTFPQASEAR